MQTNCFLTNDIRRSPQVCKNYKVLQELSSISYYGKSIYKRSIYISNYPPATYA